jgi:hypothetical protein
MRRGTDEVGGVSISIAGILRHDLSCKACVEAIALRVRTGSCVCEL